MLPVGRKKGVEIGKRHTGASGSPVLSYFLTCARLSVYVTLQLKSKLEIDARLHKTTTFHNNKFKFVEFLKKDWEI